MKKLSLKRKLLQDKLEIKDSRFNSNVEEATATKSVKTNPEIEGDDVIIVEQRTSVSSEICAENKNSSFLECEDPSLNRLRQMILNLASKDINISPFPSINSDHSDSDIETGSTEKVEGEQPLSDVQHKVAELTPFPKVCPHFIKPKEKRRESCETLNRLPDISHKHSENSVQNKNTVNQCSSNNIGKTSATSSMYRDNNCHLLRDRNSNLYACQSQNTANINKDLQKPVDHDKQCQNKSKLSQQNTSNNTVSNEQPQSGSRSIQDDTRSDRDQPFEADTRSDRDQLFKPVPHDAVTLKCCPLCQKQFTGRENQMDIDAHIAGCLSASDDSVTW